MVEKQVKEICFNEPKIIYHHVVDKIGHDAADQHENLTTIKINYPLKEIGRCAFKMCDKLHLVDINVENDILLTNKGLRPDPSTYLSPEYIQAHLAQFDDGVSVIQTEWAFSRYSETNGFVGVPDDNTLFVMPKEFCDEVLKK